MNTTLDMILTKLNDRYLSKMGMNVYFGEQYNGDGFRFYVQGKDSRTKPTIVRCDTYNDLKIEVVKYVNVIYLDDLYERGMKEKVFDVVKGVFDYNVFEEALSDQADDWEELQETVGDAMEDSLVELSYAVSCNTEEMFDRLLNDKIFPTTNKQRGPNV